MATIRLPRLLGESSRGGLSHDVIAEDLAAALEGLFRAEPSLRMHLVDETSAIRQHVLIFVDGKRADLSTPIRPDSQIRVLQAVSGG